MRLSMKTTSNNFRLINQFLIFHIRSNTTHNSSSNRNGLTGQKIHTKKLQQTTQPYTPQNSQSDGHSAALDQPVNQLVIESV